MPSRADYALEAVGADGSQAALLGVEPGFPLLSASAITFDQSDRAIELSRGLFRGDRYRFHTTLLTRTTEVST
jgi:GntR family transcriptional regulator